jgi:hypothetical protein
VARRVGHETVGCSRSGRIPIFIFIHRAISRQHRRRHLAPAPRHAFFLYFLRSASSSSVAALAAAGSVGLLISVIRFLGVGRALSRHVRAHVLSLCSLGHHHAPCCPVCWPCCPLPQLVVCLCCQAQYPPRVAASRHPRVPPFRSGCLVRCCPPPRPLVEHHQVTLLGRCQ